MAALHREPSTSRVEAPKRRSPRQPTALPIALRAKLTDEQMLERAEWIARTTQRLHTSACEQDMAVTGDWRIRASDAARLVNVSEGTLANLRSHGAGPAYLKVGRQVTYGFRDLAIWLWARRNDPDSQGFT